MRVQVDLSVRRRRGMSPKRATLDRARMAASATEGESRATREKPAGLGDPLDGTRDDAD